MTCLEKLKIEHPDKYEDATLYCPSFYGYLDDPSCCGDDGWSCANCWNRDIEEEEDKAMEAAISAIKEEARKTCENILDAAEQICNPHILDSGHRREFETGAVRDICEGKGRCDLMPLDVVAMYIEGDPNETDFVLWYIDLFQNSGAEHYLFGAVNKFTKKRDWNTYTMLLEVAKHFEEGCKKYGDNNWQKGIPARCYVDSAVRHYLKYLRGDVDEPHDRAFCWNILCCIWTCKHKPELNDYANKTVG